ncbi:MAG: tRNA (adenosine(37)-N6)-threonylcarbamoyltransferase complex dimerization subunit type 1 TsaB, partial [Pseudomonadota bacterium]
LRDASVAPQEIDRIGVVVGPGAFAGVRVGLAFARAFSLGLKAACIGVTSLEALAASAFPERQTPDIASAEARRTYYVAPVIDARRGQVYAALYDAQGAAIVDPFVAAPDAALETITASMGASAPKPDAGEAKVFILGDGAGLIDGPPDWRRLERLAIDPSMVARMAMAKEVMATRPAPLYLRPPDAKAPQQSLFAGLVAGDTLSESGKG